MKSTLKSSVCRLSGDAKRLRESVAIAGKHPDLRPKPIRLMKYCVKIEK